MRYDDIPEKSFCITFDDGYEDNYINALPILQKYNFKATIYLVPNYEHNSWENFEDKHFDKLLNIKQIQTMLNSDLIEFGSHTLNHINLLSVPIEIAKKEIQDSKMVVEQKIQKECKAFAYPYGKYDDKIVNVVKETGYSSATTVKRGFFEKDNKFMIKRIGILGTESFLDFYLKISRGRNKL